MPSLPEEPIVVLTPDQTAVAAKEIKNLHFVLATLQQSLESDTSLSVKQAKTYLTLSEFYLRDLCQALSIQTNGSDEIASRNASLREAHQRIRLLEAQLGNAQSPEQVNLGVKALAEKLDQWWKHEGFGHVSDIHFGAYGVRVKFSCMLFGHCWSGSATPVTDQANDENWHANLVSRGFVLKAEKGNRDPVVADCDQNRNLLIELFNQRLPSAMVTGFQINGSRGLLCLREVDVFIKNYQDIQDLPMSEE